MEEDLVDCFRITRVMFNFGCNQKSLLIEDTKTYHKWKTLKKGKSKDQRSCCMAAMVGSLYSAQLPKENSENASLMVFKVPMNRASP